MIQWKKKKRYTKNEIDSQNNNKNEEKKNETIQRLKIYEKQYNSLCSNILKIISRTNWKPKELN